jgi:hypothetical protein
MKRIVSLRLKRAGIQPPFIVRSFVVTASFMNDSPKNQLYDIISKIYEKRPRQWREVARSSVHAFPLPASLDLVFLLCVRVSIHDKV